MTLPMKKMFKKNFFFNIFKNHLKEILIFLSVHKKFQPNRSSRLAGYRQHIYSNVLFYYIDKYIFMRYP